MMPLPVVLQLIQAGLSLALGAALGLWYDFLKALRLRARRRWLTDLLDLLFWLPAGVCLFALGMGPGYGQLRIFMVLSAACGATLYFCILSAVVLPLASRFWEFWARVSALLGKPLICAKNSWKKYAAAEKKRFPKRKKWFTITNNPGSEASRKPVRGRRRPRDGGEAL